LTELSSRTCCLENLLEAIGNYYLDLSQSYARRNHAAAVHW
jgi:hypothetical protein